MKNVLLIDGHPNKDSFNSGLCNAYRSGALTAPGNLREIVIRDLKFDPDLHFGYHKRMELEADLVDAWNKILWADHLVWVHPVWWGGLPAILKGFVDRVFLPGHAFKYRDNSLWWDKLLTGKTARIITTMDQPAWYYRLAFGRPSINQLKKSILEYCGITPVRVTCIGPIKTADEALRNTWLSKVEKLGRRSG
jgi:NAD(P)H dehydrogenase (quinone)